MNVIDDKINRKTIDPYTTSYIQKMTKWYPKRKIKFSKTLFWVCWVINTSSIKWFSKVGMHCPKYEISTHMCAIMTIYVKWKSICSLSKVCESIWLNMSTHQMTQHFASHVPYLANKCTMSRVKAGDILQRMMLGASKSSKLWNHVRPMFTRYKSPYII